MTDAAETGTTETKTATATTKPPKAAKSPKAPKTAKPRPKSKRPPVPSRYIPKSAFADVDAVSKRTGVPKSYLRGKIIDAYTSAIAAAVAGVNVSAEGLAAGVLRARLATLGDAGTGDVDGGDDAGTINGPADLPFGE